VAVIYFIEFTDSSLGLSFIDTYVNKSYIRTDGQNKILTYIKRQMDKTISIRVSATSNDLLKFDDKTPQYIEDFLKKEDMDNKVFAVFEYKSLDEDTGILDNPHYHIVIIGAVMCQAFSKKFKRYMISRNSDYEDKGKGGKRKIYLQEGGDIERLYRYFCKGHSKEEQPLVELNSVVLTTEQIEEYHELYWEEYENINKKVSVEEKVKKPSVNADAVFLDWFRTKRLESYRRLDLLTNQESYAFVCEELIEDVLTFYNAHDKGFKKQLLEHKLHLIYNSIIRVHHPQMFQEYRKELTRQIQFSNSCFV